MIRGSCHCGAVSFELASTPEWLTACNCSICRRIDALWAYGETGEIRLLRTDDATFGYSWGDRNLAFHSCRTCGCTTHWESLRPESTRMGVNCRMADPGDIAALRVRHLDGADSWTWLD